MTAWIPYADDELEITATRSVERIADAIANDCSVTSSMSLWEGGTGLFLALALLSRGGSRPALLAASEAMWSDTIERLAGTVVEPGLYAGFCGVGWVDAFFGDGPDQGGDDSVHEQLERVLLLHLERCHGARHVIGFDLISGLVGFGIYALERRGRGLSQQVLRAVVEELVDRAVEQEVGCTWMNESWPSVATGPRRQDLGLAHGVPGVVAFLARAGKADQLSARGRAALEGGVEWLLHSKRPMASGLRYPYALSTDGTPNDPYASRVAWCYGDLSVAAALLMAGECYDRPKWSHEALVLALNCAQVPFQHSGVRDHGLCHGATGVAHVLARMSAVLGSEELRTAARRWLRKAMEMRVPGTGIDGYARMRPRNPRGRSAEERGYHLVTDRGFLMGAGGVALALAASCSQEDPAWDRVLLLSS